MFETEIWGKNPLPNSSFFWPKYLPHQILILHTVTDKSEDAHDIGRMNKN